MKKARLTHSRFTLTWVLSALLVMSASSIIAIEAFKVQTPFLSAPSLF